MTDRSAIEDLLKHPKWGNGIALERFDRLLDALGLKAWLKTIDAIKITGSNGKGTVALFTNALLNQVGVSTGLYTSPHLFRLNERIAINGSPVDDALLNAHLGRVFDLLSTLDALYPEKDFGGFEILTAAALLCFQSVDPQLLVVEAGVGGRYDITRLVPGKTTAITSIDLEHTQILGATRELILYDKSDLCPPGGALFAAELDDTLRRKLDVYATLRNLSVEYIDPQHVLPQSASLPANLQHNRTNAALSIRLCEDWMKRHSIDYRPAALVELATKTLAQTRLPLRCERVCEQPTIFVDVAHTPAALARSIDTVRAKTGQTPIMVLGVGIAKDLKQISDTLADMAMPHIILVEDQGTFAAPDAFKTLLSRAAESPEIQALPTTDRAFEAAVGLAQEKRLPVLITGSHLIAVSADCYFSGKHVSELDRY